MLPALAVLSDFSRRLVDLGWRRPRFIDPSTGSDTLAAQDSDSDPTASEQLATSPRAVSCSSSSSSSTIAAVPTTEWSSERNPSWDGLLMDEVPAIFHDPAWQQRQIRARRRIKAIIFNNLDIDWKSIPALEDTPFKISTLLDCAALRCKNSTNHFGLIVKEHWNAVETDRLTSVDGVPVYDMIG